MGPFRLFLPSLTTTYSLSSTGIGNLLLSTRGLLSSLHGSSSLSSSLPQFGFFLSCRSHRSFSTSNSAPLPPSISGTAPALSFYATKSHCRACGIVGMPNVGKSTLFNALTKTQAAQASNYPFCTIEPNLGRVVVPDERLEVLSSIEKSQKLIPLQIEFVDIAGLVRGASKGQGLGNQFLSTIRQVSLIAHMVRCFEDDIITHVDETVDPIRDIDTINTELILADLDMLEKLGDKLKSGKTKDPKRSSLIERTIEGIPSSYHSFVAALYAGRTAGSVQITQEEWPIMSSLQLLTCKPTVYVLNVKDTEAAIGNELTKKVQESLASSDPSAAPEIVTVCANLESDVANLEGDENSKKEFLEMYGLSSTGLTSLIQASRRQLGQLTFYTVGPQEAHAWSISKGTTASEAAGRIHTDIQKGFIRAETISYDDFVKFGGEKGAREKGKLRLEGAAYQCQDGDIYHFRFNPPK